MAVIYVREQGSVIRKRGGRLLIEKDKERLAEVPLLKTSAVAVFGNVQVTTQALSELLERAIPLALFTRNGRYKGHLTPAQSKNVTLRLEQYRQSQDGARCVELAKAAVRAKLWNSAVVVRDHHRNYPSGELAAAVRELEDAAERVVRAATLDEVRGHEGAGAASYFRAFAVMNRSDLPFDGRERRPAPDPVNARLSLTYMMVMNELRGAGVAPLAASSVSIASSSANTFRPTKSLLWTISYSQTSQSLLRQRILSGLSITTSTNP